MYKRSVAIWAVILVSVLSYPAALSKSSVSHSASVVLPKGNTLFEECLTSLSRGRYDLDHREVERLVISNLREELIKVKPSLMAQRKTADALWVALVSAALQDSNGQTCRFFVYDPRAARTLWYLHQAAIVAEQFPQPNLRLAGCLNAIASIYIGNPELISSSIDIESMLIKAIGICRTAGDDHRLHLANCYFMLGQFYLQARNYDSSKEGLEHALEIYNGVGNASKLDIGAVQSAIAHCYMKQCKFDLASQFFRKSLQSYESEKIEFVDEMQALHGAAVSSALIGDPDAVRLLERSRKQHEPRPCKEEDLYFLALLNCKKDNFKDAISQLSEAASSFGTPSLWGAGNGTINDAPVKVKPSLQEQEQLYEKILLSSSSIYRRFDTWIQNQRLENIVYGLLQVAKEKSEKKTIPANIQFDLSSYLKLLESRVAGYYRPPVMRLADSEKFEQYTTVDLDLDKEGNIRAIKVIDSSGHNKNDNLAVKALVAAMPFRPLSNEDNSIPPLEAKFYPERVLLGTNNPGRVIHHIRKGVSISANPDFDKYMKNLGDKIKRSWFPAPADKAWEAVVDFQVGLDGNSSNIEIVKSSGVAWLDESCIQAIKWATPFDPLPFGATKPASIHYSFTSSNVRQF